MKTYAVYLCLLDNMEYRIDCDDAVALTEFNNNVWYEFVRYEVL